MRNKIKTGLQCLKCSGHTLPPSFYIIILCCKSSKRFVFKWSQFLDPKRNRDFRRSPHIYTPTNTKRQKKSYNVGFRVMSRTRQASMLSSRLYIKNQLLPWSEGLWSKKQENNKKRKTWFIFFLARSGSKTRRGNAHHHAWLLPMALYSYAAGTVSGIHPQHTAGAIATAFVRRNPRQHFRAPV